MQHYTQTSGNYVGKSTTKNLHTLHRLPRRADRCPTNPELSFLLRAPLAKEAGGLGICSRIVFESKNDPVYAQTLRSIQRTHQQLLAGKRFDMPGFRPNNDYIREMQKYGFVKKDLGPDELFDYYQAEREYFDSFYYDPEIQDVRSANIR